MMSFRFALAAATVAGVGAVSGTALAGQPIDLLTPAPLTLPGVAIQQAPLPFSYGAVAVSPKPAAAVSRYVSAMPYLDAAQTALQGGRYGATLAALEQAETRLLNDGAISDSAKISPGGQALVQVRLARDAAIRRDRQTALTAVSMAIAATKEQQQPMPVVAEPVSQASAVLPAPAAPPAPPAPMITKALLPGHWQLGAWQNHWVPPETQLRTVESHPWVQGHYVWQNGAWTWVPSHYGDE